MLAGLVGIPELILTADEAKNLGIALDRVQRLYKASWISEEKKAWINLAMVGGVIYGSRFMAYRKRTSVERKAETPRKPITSETEQRLTEITNGKSAPVM
jgi:hypothetical protein